MDFSKLSYGQINSISSELKTSSTQMESLLSEIKTMLNKVGEGSAIWSGDAANSVRQSFNSLSSKFPEFSASVSDCSKYLDSVVETYKSVDSQIMENM